MIKATLLPKELIPPPIAPRKQEDVVVVYNRALELRKLQRKLRGVEKAPHAASPPCSEKKTSPSSQAKSNLFANLQVHEPGEQPILTQVPSLLSPPAPNKTRLKDSSPPTAGPPHQMNPDHDDLSQWSIGESPPAHEGGGSTSSTSQAKVSCDVQELVTKETDTSDRTSVVSNPASSSLTEELAQLDLQLADLDGIDLGDIDVGDIDEEALDREIDDLLKL